MDSFHHEALFYEDQEQYLAGTVPFIREGLEAGEQVLVAVNSDRIELLSAEVGGPFDRLRFLDMPTMGQNPARIIPVWQDFVNENVNGHSARGIGEPVWPERSHDELTECDHHESLLNLAFKDAPAWKLLCPYDASSLDQDTLEGARRNHPVCSEDGDEPQPSDSYAGPEHTGSPFAGELADPHVPTQNLDFSLDNLAGVRRFAMQSALDEGFDMERTTDLTLAVSEVAANSILYAGGTGRLRIWREPEALICEVLDSGRFEDPMVGRVRPSTAHDSKGLWLVNNLCDLVQIRSGEDGSAIRLHMRA